MGGREGEVGGGEGEREEMKMGRMFEVVAPWTDGQKSDKFT